MGHHSPITNRRGAMYSTSIMSTSITLVGCGQWPSSAYVPAVRAIPSVGLVASVGESQAEPDAFGARHQIPGRFESLGQVLSPKVLDSVIIATPRRPTTIDGGRGPDRGVAVFRDTRLAKTAADALRLTSTQQRGCCHASVAYSFRYRKPSSAYAVRFAPAA